MSSSLVSKMADAIVQNVLARASEEEAEQIKSLQVDKLVELEFDLGNLLAYDSNEIDLQQLRQVTFKLLTCLYQLGRSGE